MKKLLILGLLTSLSAFANEGEKELICNDGHMVVTLTGKTMSGETKVLANIYNKGVVEYFFGRGVRADVLNSVPAVTTDEGSGKITFHFLTETDSPDRFYTMTKFKTYYFIRRDGGAEIRVRKDGQEVANWFFQDCR